MWQIPRNLGPCATFPKVLQARRVENFYGKVRKKTKSIVADRHVLRRPQYGEIFSLCVLLFVCLPREIYY